jgi:hypothetical protein
MNESTPHAGGRLRPEGVLTSGRVLWTIACFCSAFAGSCASESECVEFEFEAEPRYASEHVSSNRFVSVDLPNALRAGAWNRLFVATRRRGKSPDSTRVARLSYDDGSPVCGLPVALFDIAFTERDDDRLPVMVDATTTDPSGRFSYFEGDLPLVVASIRLTWEVSAFVVLGGETDREITLLRPCTDRIDVSIIDASTGSAVAGAEVCFSFESWPFRATYFGSSTSDSSGKCNLPRFRSSGPRRFLDRHQQISVNGWEIERVRTCGGVTAANARTFEDAIVVTRAPSHGGSIVLYCVDHRSL